MANEVQVSFSEKLTDALVSSESALPKEFNRTRFVQNCLQVLNDNPNLARINPAQLKTGLLKGAYLGLDFSMKECYLIPYGNSVQFQTSYIGEIKFVKRYSIRPIQDIYAKVVREGDEFLEEIVDGRQVVNYKAKPFNNGEIIGVFAVVLYKDGGCECESMSKEEVNETRSNYSKQANGNAWKKSWSEMAKKTVLRRLCKHIETDFESVEAHNAWEDGSDASFSTVTQEVHNSDEVVDAFSDVIDVEGEVVNDGE